MYFIRYVFFHEITHANLTLNLISDILHYSNICIYIRDNSDQYLSLYFRYNYNCNLYIYNFILYLNLRIVTIVIY